MVRNSLQKKCHLVMGHFFPKIIKSSAVAMDGKLNGNVGQLPWLLLWMMRPC